MLKLIGRISDDAEIKIAIQEATAKVIESKAVAASVVAGTATLALSDVDSYISLVAKIAAAMLSIILAVKHGYDIWREYKKAKKEDEDTKDNR
jgi:hypothetical protein